MVPLTSAQFEEGFMDILSRRHGTKRMHSNVVYQEFIGDKLHVHMNATQWTTLASFVQYLGRLGKVAVDETEKGFYISYIDRDPAAMARQEAREKKDKMEMDDEERTRRFIEKQSKMAKAQDTKVAAAPTALVRAEGEGKLEFGVSLAQKQKPEESTKPKITGFAFDKVKSGGAGGGGGGSGSGSGSGGGGSSGSGSGSGAGEKRKMSSIDLLMAQDKKRKTAQAVAEVKKTRQDNWIRRNLVVKVCGQLHQRVDGEPHSHDAVHTLPELHYLRFICCSAIPVLSDTAPSMHKARTPLFQH